MKVLLVGPMPDPITGVSIANEAFVEGVKRNGGKISIINTHVQKGVSSQQGSKFSFSKVVNFLSIYIYLYKIFSSDVLYLTPGQTFFGILKYAPFILTAKLTGKSYFIHVHGNYLGKEYEMLQSFKKKIFRYLIKSASGGIVLSESLRPNFRGLLPAGKVFVVENFVADELIREAEKTSPVIGLKILFLSNLMKEKGILDLLEALQILKKKGIPFNAIIAGAIETEIKELVENHLSELAPMVSYSGVLKGKAKANAFRSSNTFVLPTYYIMEGQPISILEAMAFGNVIVTTRHAGIPDVVGDQNALFVEKQNPDDLAKKFEMIFNDPASTDQFFEVNRSIARERFTEKRFADQLYTILNSK